MTKEYFDAVNDMALLVIINRYEEENEKIKADLAKSEEQRTLLSELNKEQIKQISDLVGENVDLSVQIKKQDDDIPAISNETKAINIITQIKSHCVEEASLVNQMFGRSEELGIMALFMATDSFERFLQSNNPLFVRGMSIEYRTFVIELLLLIDEPYRDIATAKILMG